MATTKTAAKKTRATAADWLDDPDATKVRKSTRTAKATTTKKPASKKPVAKKKAASPKKPARPSSYDEHPAEDEDLEWGEVKKPGAKKAGAKKYAKLALKPLKIPTRTVGTGKTARKVKAKKLSAAQMVNMLVEQTEMPRKDVRMLLETMSNIVKSAIMPGGVGGAVVPGVGAVMRKDIAAKKMPAVKRGTVIEKRNPRTGETTKYKHPGQKAWVKPARTRVRSVPLSALRRAANGTE